MMTPGCHIDVARAPTEAITGALVNAHDKLAAIDRARLAPQLANVRRWASVNDGASASTGVRGLHVDRAVSPHPPSDRPAHARARHGGTPPSGSDPEKVPPPRPRAGLVVGRSEPHARPCALLVQRQPAEFFEELAVDAPSELDLVPSVGIDGTRVELHGKQLPGWV